MSYTQIAIDKVNSFFEINEADKLYQKAAKVSGRVPTQTLLTLAALTETVFFGALTALSSPLYAFSKTQDMFTNLKNHTISSAQAFINAGKAIAGYGYANAAAEQPKIEEASEADSNKQSHVEENQQEIPSNVESNDEVPSQVSPTEENIVDDTQEVEEVEQTETQEVNEIIEEEIPAADMSKYIKASCTALALSILASLYVYGPSISFVEKVLTPLYNETAS